MGRIVITGAAGLVGGVLAADLERDYEVRKIDRAWRHGLLRRRQDMRRLGFAEQALAGARTVVDLAGDPRIEVPWKSVLRANLPASLTAFEAAHQAGVERVIYASSSHVTGLYERDEPYASICSGRYDKIDRASIPKITSSFPVRPDSPYGVGKAAAEAAARYYSEELGLSVICLRIGTVYRANRPGSPRGYATILSHADLARLVRACIAAPPEVRFGILYGVSDNTWRFWDIEEGRRLVGYEPLDDGEQWRSS
jgi:NAD+ dependent glucose-6-phosphate dehydrogenase